MISISDPPDETIDILRDIPTQTLIDALWVKDWPQGFIEGAVPLQLGQKMAGRMGNEKNTIQSVTVVGIDEDKNYLLVNGSVPGKKGNIVQVRPAVKLLNADEKNTTSTKIIERNNKEEVLEEE